MSLDDQHDPWKPGMRGFVRGAIWTAVMLAVAWWLWGAAVDGFLNAPLDLRKVSITLSEIANLCEHYIRFNAPEADRTLVSASRDNLAEEFRLVGYLWNYDEFKAHITSKPLNKREAIALEVLAKFGVACRLTFDR